jgi:hypothetical protein
VRRTLKSIPSSIQNVYLRTWETILEDSAKNAMLAKTVLVWVLYASRSMTIEELERAVATSPVTQFEPRGLVSGATLISFCRGLVVLEEEGRLVRLVRK